MYSQRILLLSVIIAGLTLASDSIHFEPVEVRKPVTSVQVANSCSPSKIINLKDINISVGSSWKVGHSYHCLGHPHIVTTINRIGLLHIDKLVSHAIVLNYVWMLTQTEEMVCKDEVEKIEPVLVDKEGGILFAAYILSCEKVQ